MQTPTHIPPSLPPSPRRQGRAAKHREKNKTTIGVQTTTPVLTANELRAALEGPGGLKESGWTLGRDEEGKDEGGREE